MSMICSVEIVSSRMTSVFNRKEREADCENTETNVRSVRVSKFDILCNAVARSRDGMRWPSDVVVAGQK